MPTPVSATRDLDRAIVPLRRDRHRAAARREPNGVVHEVEQHLMDAFTIGIDIREILGKLIAHSHAAVGSCDIDLGHHLGHHRRERHLAPLQRHLSRLKRRQIEQLLHEPAEALGLGQHHLQRVRVGPLHPVQQVLQVRADRRDGGLQLVRDVGHEVATGALEVLEFGAHPIEGGRELAHLVAAARVHPLAVVAGLHLLRGRRPCRATAGSSHARATSPSAARSTTRASPPAGTATRTRRGTETSRRPARSRPCSERAPRRRRHSRPHPRSPPGPRRTRGASWCPRARDRR